MTDDRVDGCGACDAARPSARDFIREIIDEHNRTGRFGGRVHTRFPPEPNGYLHIGHAKSICLNFGIAREYGGLCNLRFDDTNPSKEEVEYVDSIMNDIRWLGFDWEDRLYYASDYFGKLYEFAERLILKGSAYVCELTADEVKEHRGTLTEPGRNSPWRDRPAAGSLDLFRRMRAGEFADGSMTLRARIDMASPNLNMRDPVIYRILRASHHRTGDAWCIYPMYDYAHPISDSLEGITHSICTLEFEDHRPLYDWFLEELDIHRSRQIEFARLNLTHTVMSKRKFLQLVNEGLVRGWDDPRMPTLAGIRRRGYPPAAIRAFAERIGVAKRDSVVDIALLEHCVREELNRTAPRAMAVLRPVRLVVENYPAGMSEEIEFTVNPEDLGAGTRTVPFSGELFIDRDDFREIPPPKYHRLSPGVEVRLRYAYLVTCTGVEKDPRTGEVTTIRCVYDPASRGGDAPDGRRVKATIHWVSAAHSVPAEVRLYDHLFSPGHPGSVEGVHWKDEIDPHSLEVLQGCRIEGVLAGSRPGEAWQFERQGYFCVDPDSSPAMPVFNRTVTLRDTWAKIERSQGGGA